MPYPPRLEPCAKPIYIKIGQIQSTREKQCQNTMTPIAPKPDILNVLSLASCLAPPRDKRPDHMWSIIPALRFRLFSVARKSRLLENSSFAQGNRITSVPEEWIQAFLLPKMWCSQATRPMPALPPEVDVAHILRAVRMPGAGGPGMTASKE
jgi:hypothetical protein